MEGGVPMQTRSLEFLVGQHTIKRLSLSLALFGIGSLGSLPGCTTSTKTVEVQRTITTEAALSDFDRMWELIDTTHYDPEHNGVDWDSVRDELRPQAQDARNRREIRSVMREALDRLGQSHFGIIAEADDEVSKESDTSETSNDSSHADSTDQAQTTTETIISEDSPADDSASDGTGDGDTGIDLRILDGQAVVTAVRDQSPAQRAGVQTGWVLTNVRSRELADGLARLREYLDEIEFDINARRMILGNNLQGPPGTTIDLTFLNRDDEVVELNITRAPMPGEFVKFGNLPPMSTHLEWDRFTTTNPDGQSTEIGVIAFNIWMIPIMAQFEKAMFELRDVDGLIIDVRGNPGGIGGLAPAISRFLVSEKSSLGTMSMRGTDLQFNAEPVIVTTWGERLDPFTGPIAILIDTGSASTSEVFAGGLHSLGRVETFGTRSAGMALPAAMDKLPSGDVLLHAIADFVTSTGYRLEKDGVQLDHYVPLTREDLSNGIDSPKQAATEWIAQETAE